MLAENSGTKSAATVLTELSAAHKEEHGKTVGYNIDAEQSLGTDLVGTFFAPPSIVSNIHSDLEPLSGPSRQSNVPVLLQIMTKVVFKIIA
jgi:hypothetical protein